MRGIASNFAIVSAHRSALDRQPWGALAQIDTLVFLMGAAHVAEICARLIAAGRDPRTPAAAVERGTTPQQREVWAPLRELAAAFAAAGLRAPAAIVVGEVTVVARVLRGELAAEAVA
jgi:siroheme synthase